MYPFESYPILASVVERFRRSQQKTLALAAAAVAETGEASSLSIAQHMAAKTDVKVQSALRRLYRLLANPRIDDGTLTEALLGLVARQTWRLILAVDWTEWAEDLRLLVASVATGRRALPVQTAALRPSEIRDSQNRFEDAFLRRLVAHLESVGAQAVLLADRGFRRASLVRLLTELRQPFVVRLQANVSVRRRGEAPVVLARARLSPGRAIDFGWVELTQSKPVPVRVVGVWAKGQKEPWWFATNLEGASLAELATLYDRRMSVEEEIRDSKGARFGMKLAWTQFQKGAHLARMALLVGLALLVWTAIGTAAARRDPTVQLPDRRKGPRLSLAHVGLARLRAGLAHRCRIGVRFVLENLPPPTLRTFPWLEHASARAT